MTKPRPPATCMYAEPPFPGLATVMMCHSAPDWLLHEPRPLCGIQEPHHVSECNEWARLGLVA